MKIRVAPLEQKELDRGYDLALGAIGYETRAKYFFEHGNRNFAHRHVLEFAEQRVIAFDENKAFFKSSGFDSLPCDLGSIQKWASLSNGPDLKQNRAVSAVVDIS